MKIALVCIAKNEDHYIEEWCDFNLKLGFDDIFIYQNNWRCGLNKKNIHKIPFDGFAKQTDSYNHFIKNNVGKYDWVAFFDVDEFLVLKKHKNIKDFVLDYSNYSAIGVNWVLFGDNGQEKVVNNNYSVINRFTKRENKINKHIKTIAKLNKNLVMSIHNPSNSNWVDTNKIINNGSFNENGDDKIAQINHYFVKTKEEFLLKVERGNACGSEKRKISQFDSHNFNDVEDLTAFKFYYNDNNNLFNT